MRRLSVCESCATLCEGGLKRREGLLAVKLDVIRNLAAGLQKCKPLPFPSSIQYHATSSFHLGGGGGGDFSTAGDGKRMGDSSCYRHLIDMAGGGDNTILESGLIFL